MGRSGKETCWRLQVWNCRCNSGISSGAKIRREGSPHFSARAWFLRKSDVLRNSVMHSMLQGYPTIKHFKQGADGKKEVVDYNGGRVAADLVQFVEARLEQVGSFSPIPEIVKTVGAPDRAPSAGALSLAHSRSRASRCGRIHSTPSATRSAAVPSASWRFCPTSSTTRPAAATPAWQS
jgi:hypothetical protein